MSLIALDGVRLAYGGTIVLDDVDLQLSPGDRLALVGRNGIGKTSLLEIMAGRLEPSSGRVVRQPGIGMAYLSQIAEMEDHDRLLDAVVSCRHDLLDLRAKICAEQQKVSESHGSADRLQRLEEFYRVKGGQDLERRAAVALRSVGFDPARFDQSTTLLSGGERRRLLLARVLVMDAEVLLLDEPTNHLDLQGIEFLEQLLCSFAGAAVVVSHDRTFIDHFASGIACLESGGKLVGYPSGYQRYLELRRQRREEARRAYDLQRKEIERQKEIIRRTHAAKGQKARMAKSRKKALDKIESLTLPPPEPSTMSVRLAEIEPSGKVTFQVKDLILRPGGQTLLEKATFNIQRGERVGIIGPNGCGKSTLLKTLALQQTPAAGKIQHGYRVLIGYFDQERSSLVTGRTVLEHLQTARPELPDQTLRDIAGRFLFSGDEVQRKIETFSGGEQSRLALALLLLGQHNVLLLDEPTNHLDIPSREVLEEALESFSGTILVVSHDRYFLDRIVGRLLSFEGRTLADHLGKYSELREAGKIMCEVPRQAPQLDPEKQKRRQSYQEHKRQMRDRQKRERRIAELEELSRRQNAQMEELSRRMADPAMALDWEGLERLHQEKLELQKEHRRVESEWEELLHLQEEEEEGG